jgi:hypothetical protein
MTHISYLTSQIQLYFVWPKTRKQLVRMDLVTTN